MLSKKYKLMHPVHNVVTTLPIGQLLIALKRLYTYEIGIVSESFGPGQKISKGSMWLKIPQKMNWIWDLEIFSLFTFLFYLQKGKMVIYSFTHIKKVDIIWLYLVFVNRLLEYFSERMISEETLRRNHVMQRRYEKQIERVY